MERKSLESTFNKKGQIQTLAPAILGLVFAATILVFGLIILQSLRDTDAVDGGAVGSLTYNDSAWAAANKTVIGLGAFADFWEIIVLAVVITIVIGLLLVVFGGRQRS